MSEPSPGLLRRALWHFFQFAAQSYYRSEEFPSVFGMPVGSKVADYAFHSSRCDYALVEVKSSNIKRAVKQLEEFGRELAARNISIVLLIVYIGRPGRQAMKYRASNGYLLERKGGSWKQVIVSLGPRRLPIRAITSRDLEVLRRRVSTSNLHTWGDWL